MKLQQEPRGRIDVTTSNSPRDEGRATHPPYQVEVFYDGGCPLCLREINMLRRWDKNGQIRFTDIDDPAFTSLKVGKTYDELMDHIQGRLPSGEWIEGVEVFRRLYSAVGFGLLVAPTRLPIVSHLLDWGYRLFAKNRLRLTGRCKKEGCALNAQNQSA